MAKKKRRARARKAKTNPKKKTHRRKRRRALAANPAPKRRRSHRRRRSNPKRRRHAAHFARRSRRNPARKRHFARRRHRRNPGLPVYAQAAIAAGLATLTFAGLSVGTSYLSARLDPTGQTVGRNQKIAAGLAIVGGLALAAKKSPLMGAGIAAGGLVYIAGGTIALKLASLLAPKVKTNAADVPIGAYAPMGDYARMSAVYGNGNMNAVYGNMGAILDSGHGGVVPGFTPAAPWHQAGPFN